MICNVVLVSDVQQSESVLHIHAVFFRFFSHIGLYGVLCRSLLVIYFVYSSAYISIPISQFIPFPPSLGNYVCFHSCDSICFESKFICTIFKDSTYKQYHVIFVFLCLTYFTEYDNLWAHPCCCKWHHSILFCG